MVTSYKIPSTWAIKKLGEVCFTTSGGTPSRSNPNYYNGTIPWVKSGELDRGVILETEERITEEAIRNSSAKVFPKGTLLIALYGATIGKLAFLGIDAATNQAVCGIYKNENIHSNFLSHFLYFKRPSLVKEGIGGAQPNISQGILKNLELPIPPIDEQERIVAKIEELFSELDAGVASLKKAQAQLKVYRQAVLKSAFEGKLTNENVFEGKFPDGWRLVKLNEVATSRLGKMLDKNKNTGDLQPYLRNLNVRWGFFDLSNLLEMRFEKSESEKFGLKQGDLVICEGGEPGRGAIWKESNSPMKIQKALHRVRFSKSTSANFFLYFLIYSAKSKLLDKYFTGTTIKHLTGESLRQIEFPLPSVEEQYRIVEGIETRFSVCDKLDETIAASLKRSEVLRQSILEMAFEGALVGQNANDEPVSVLLENITRDHEEFLAVEKLNKKNLSRVSTKRRMAEKLKSIIQMLEENGGLMGTHTLWQSTEFKNDIDKFYAEVKELLAKGRITETPREGRESFLRLVASK